MEQIGSPELPFTRVPDLLFFAQRVLSDSELRFILLLLHRSLNSVDSKVSDHRWLMATGKSAYSRRAAITALLKKGFIVRTDRGLSENAPSTRGDAEFDIAWDQLAVVLQRQRAIERMSK